MRQQQLQIVTINPHSSFYLSFSLFLFSSLAVFSVAHTHPAEGLPDTVSLNSTWQGVAPSNTANVTAVLRSQTRGGSENNESSHLVFEITDDILLIFFLLLSLSTSLDIKMLAGYLLLEPVHSLHMSLHYRLQKQKETSEQRCTWNLPPVWVQFVAQSYSMTVAVWVL